MSTWKRAAAAFLTVCMLMSMMVFPSVGAATLEETVTLGFGEAAWEDGACTVPITASGANDTFGVRNIELLVKFDPNVLQLDKVTGKIPNVVKEVDEEEVSYRMSPSSINTKLDADKYGDMSLKDMINQYGCVYLLIVDTSTEHSDDHIITSGNSIVELKFTTKEGQEGKSSAFSFQSVDAPYYEGKEIIIGTASEDVYQLNVSATTTVTVPGSEATTYTVKFVDEDGTELSSAEYAAGTPAADIVKPSDPAKEGYTFAGWTPTIADVTDNATYTATYSGPTVQKYTVKFVDEDGTELSSQEYDAGTAAAEIAKPSDPTKEGYTFAGWTPEIADVTANATYTATYAAQKYTVKFVNDDGTELSSQEYDYGTKVADIVKPSDPSKEGYTFNGWTPTIVDVTANATYTATYSGPVVQYTVKFFDDDGTELSSQNYAYGTKAADIVKPSDPIKAPTANATYTFREWTPTIVDVTADANYTAAYTETKTSPDVTKYTVKFVDDDGTELSSQEYPEGTKAADIVKPANPTKAATADMTYTFREWSPAIVDVTANATYTATYDGVPITNPQPQPGGDDPQGGGGCYVATAVYGSYDCPQVWTLRRFRDNVLAETWYGRLFIKLYYTVSPTCVKLFGDTALFQDFFRGVLDPWVAQLQEEGFESTPYQDIDW